MKIITEACWNGSSGPYGGQYFRLLLPDGNREAVAGHTWDRRTAREALDILERIYGLKRANIRFHIR